MCIYNSKYGETLENVYKRKEEELGTPHWMCRDETGKERIMKKVQAFFLVLALSLLLVVPSYAVTDRAGSCGNQVQWSLDERTGVLTISGSGPMADYQLDWSEGEAGTWVCSKTNAPWWPYREKIKKVIVEDGVTKVGAYSFGGYVYLAEGNLVVQDGYQSLKQVEMKNSVQQVGDGAFFNAVALQKIVWSSALQSIGEAAFSYCIGLKQVSLPASLQSMGERSFSPTGMQSISLPASLKKIGPEAIGYNHIADDCYGICAPMQGFQINGAKGSSAETYAAEHPQFFRFSEEQEVQNGAAAPPMSWSAGTAPAVNATGAVVLDYDSGEFYCEKNADVARPAASMTKIMSVYLVFQEIEAGRLSLDSWVKASARAAAMSNNPAYSGLERLKAGESYQVDTLLRLIMTASCNGSVLVLAEHIGGSEAAFVARMNETAKQMGLDAKYADCCGFIDDGNAVSPRAMAQLAQRVIREYPKILEYSSLKSVSFQGKTFYSTNTLLRDGSVVGIDGLKTGTTNGARYCFTGTAKQDGRRIIAVVMNTTSSSARMSECKKLLEYGFACRAEREKVWSTADKTLSVTLRAAGTSARPYVPTAFTASFSGLPDGVKMPCTVTWLVDGAPAGAAKPGISVFNGSTDTFSYTPAVGQKQVSVTCQVQLPNGAQLEAASTVPVSQEELTFSGYLGISEVTLYQDSTVTIPCRFHCDQGVEVTFPAGWYLDGTAIPNYQNAAFHATADSKSRITFSANQLSPGEHVLEFHCNTSALPGMQQAVFQSKILVLAVPETEKAA